YSFNLDAFSIYITLAAVFIAQATNTPISMADLLTILAIALVTSKGAHGVPGSAIVVLAATLHAIPAIPAIGLVLVLSVDWFMGIARALGNLVGNCVATVAIAARRIVEAGILAEAGRPLAKVIRKLREHIADEQRAIAGADAATRAFLLADFHVCLADQMGHRLLCDVLRDLTARTTLAATLF